jgi:hypothetical protein
MKLIDLKSKINEGDFPKNYPHFGGANLIITDDANRNFHEGDVVVYSVHAGALSWLVHELKVIYDDRIDYLNKYSFYPMIGEIINEVFSKEGALIDSMVKVIDEIERRWE